jgi:hypothetical protein
MIKLLAQLFRGLHYIVAVSAPAPGTSDGMFVFAWLGGIAFLAAFFVILVFYIIPFLYFRLLSDPWQQQQTKELWTRRAITRLILRRFLCQRSG